MFVCACVCVFLQQQQQQQQQQKEREKTYQHQCTQKCFLLIKLKYITQFRQNGIYIYYTNLYQCNVNFDVNLLFFWF